MKQKETIRVRSTNKLVPDYEASKPGSGIRRFIGWKFDKSQGNKIKDPVTKVEVCQGTWIKLETPVTVPARKEYIDEIAAGNLELADDESISIYARLSR